MKADQDQRYDYRQKLEARLQRETKVLHETYLDKLRLIDRYGLLDQEVVHHFNTDFSFVSCVSSDAVDKAIFLTKNCKKTTAWLVTAPDGNRIKYITCPDCLTKMPQELCNES